MGDVADEPIDRDPGVRALLQRAVDEAARLLGADGAFLDRIDPSSGLLHWAYASMRMPEDARRLLSGIKLAPGEGLYGRAVSERRVLRSDDYLADPAFRHSPEMDRLARRLDIVSVIAAPLVSGDETFGVLGAFASRPAAFGARQAALVGALAAHAGAAIAQARLIHELARSGEELERRVEAQRALRAITARIAAIRDPDEVLHRIADECRRLMRSDAAHVTVMHESGDYLVPAVMLAAIDQATREWLGPLRLGPGSGMHALAAWSGETVWAADYGADPRIPHEPEDIDAAARMGIGAMAVAPMRGADGSVLGTVGMTYLEPREIGPEQRELLGALADQAAVAVHDSRLYERLRASEARYRLQVDRSPDLVFMTDTASRLTYVSAVARRMTGFDPDELVGQGFAAIVADGEAARVAALWERLTAEPGAHAERFALRHRDRGEVPVEVKAIAVRVDGRPTGTIHGSARDLSEAERLEAERRSQAADLAAAAERSHLARELHDSVTQALFSMTLTTRTVELLLRRDPAEARRQVQLLRDLQRDALAEMRALIFALRPGSLEKDGLGQALRTYAAAVEQRSGLRITVAHGLEDRLPATVEDALYRIAQEALHNVVKHASARHVDISVARDGETVRLSVADDGSGFDESRVPSGHLGVAGMRARVGLVGGTLELRSEPGQGTSIEVRIPISGAIAAAPA